MKPTPTIGAIPASPGSAASPFNATEILMLWMCILLPFSTDAEVAVITYATPVLAILIVSSAGNLFLGRTRITVDTVPLVIVSVLAVSTMAATSFLTEEPIKSLARVVYHLGGLMVMLMILAHRNLRAVDSRETAYERYAGMLTLSGSLLSFYYIGNFVVQSYLHGVGAVIAERWVGGLASLTWGASNTVAAALLVTLIPALDRIFSGESTAAALTIDDDLRRLLWRAVPAIVILLGIAFTQSRNGLVIAAAMTALLFTQRLSVGVIVAGIVLALVGFMVVFESEITQLLIEYRITNSDLLSLNLRTFIWQSYVERISADPLRLIGYYGTLSTYELTAHNFSLNTYIEQGPLGWLLALFLFGFCLRGTYKMQRSARSATRRRGRLYFTGWLLIAINLHFEDANYTQQYILYFWLLLGITALLITSERRQRLGIQ